MCESKVNVLYCGMADDILSPLKLVPDSDVIYVICELDSAFARGGNVKGQQLDIIEMLTLGNDSKSRHREIYATRYPDACELDEPCQILSPIVYEGNRWHLTFIYKGKERKLIYFYNNFYNTWDEEIQDISHVMSMGATFEIDKEDTLLQMLRERTRTGSKYYELGYTENKYDSTTKVRDSEIGVVDLDRHIMNMVRTEKLLINDD